MSGYRNLASTIGGYRTATVIKSNSAPAIRKLGAPLEGLTTAIAKGDNT